MQDFVAKMNKKCKEKNLGFQYEIIQEEDAPSWAEVDISKYIANTEKYDAVITNPVGPLMKVGVVPHFATANSKIPLIAASLGNSRAHYPTPPPNMFFPTPTISDSFDDIIPMFLARGFKKHVVLTENCDALHLLMPLAQQKRKNWYGEENYRCVKTQIETCRATKNNLCFRPFEEVIKEIGDADVVEFFEYNRNMPLVKYLDEQKINYKAKVFFSQFPFPDEALNVAMYGLMEQRGFSEDAIHHKEYDDAYNHLGIFAAAGNKTSQQVFNEWFYSHDSKALKLSVIGQIIGWYYLHENILRARLAQASDLTAIMRNGLFISSIIGMVGTGKSQKNDQVSKPLWLQVLPDPENNRKPKKYIMYPIDIASTYSYHEMVHYDDRDCYPECPDCYHDICNKMSTLLFISLAGFAVIFISFVTFVLLCGISRGNRMKLIHNAWIPLYSIFEMIACISAITSIHHIRQSKDTQHPMIKWSLTFFSGFDGFTAIVRCYFWIANLTMDFPLISRSMFFWLEMVDIILVVIGTGVYFIYITQSEVETRASAPQIVDITLNLIEVVLFVFGTAMVNVVSQEM